MKVRCWRWAAYVGQTMFYFSELEGCSLGEFTEAFTVFCVCVFL